jgi:hypothetical protein
LSDWPEGQRYVGRGGTGGRGRSVGRERGDSHGRSPQPKLRHDLRAAGRVPTDKLTANAHPNAGTAPAATSWRVAPATSPAGPHGWIGLRTSLWIVGTSAGIRSATAGLHHFSISWWSRVAGLQLCSRRRRCRFPSHRFGPRGVDGKAPVPRLPRPLERVSVGASRHRRTPVQQLLSLFHRGSPHRRAAPHLPVEASLCSGLFRLMGLRGRRTGCGVHLPPGRACAVGTDSVSPATADASSSTMDSMDSGSDVSRQGGPLSVARGEQHLTDRTLADTKGERRRHGR